MIEREKNISRLVDEFLFNEDLTGGELEDATIGNRLLASYYIYDKKSAREYILSIFDEYFSDKGITLKMHDIFVIARAVDRFYLGDFSIKSKLAKKYIDAKKRMDKLEKYIGV